MFFGVIILVVSSVSFLRDFYVSSCDQNCADKPEFTPSRLVVKFGDPTSASCSVCQHACINNTFNIETPVGVLKTNGTTISWTVDRLTEWDTSPLCYYNNASDYQCCTSLPVILYQPPDNVSFSFVDHTGPMFEGQQYTLQCTVEDVAPVENLMVTFYRGQTALDQRQSNNKNMKPVTEIFSFNISLSKEDDGVQYRCEAKLELGPDGPQRPPVVTSQTITTTVYYKPQLEGSSHTDPIPVTEGDLLQLNCSAVGNPSPSYNWTLPLESPSTSNSSVLTINSATFADKGKYTCSVSNAVGTVSVEFNVDVQGLKLTSTRLPPTTPYITTTASTTPTTTTATTSTASTTPTTTITSTTTTTKTTTVPSCSTSSLLLHRFIMCFMLLFSALV